MTVNENPLTGPPPKEVPLPNAPLVRVIAQVRFPLVASVDQRDFIAGFQQAIRAEYPVLRLEQSRGGVLGQQVVKDAHRGTIWRFHDSSSTWRVSLAPDFLALETISYTSRDDFFDRLKLVLDALVTHVDPQLLDRIGVRYIDRVVGNDLKDLPLLVRPEVSGIQSTALASLAVHSISEAVFVLPDDSGQVRTRWGLVPANGTIDPAAVDAINQPSWLLDVDAFLERTHEFNVGAVLKQARGFAERIYCVFRWAVTDEFLSRYGGQP